MTQSASSAGISQPPPVASAPGAYHLLGFGFYYYGDRDFDESTGSFVRTLCFCLVYIPVLALRSYRVVPAYDGWGCLGRVPLTRPAKIFSLIAAIAIPGTAAGVAGLAYWNSPVNVASRTIAEAERLEAKGQAGEAAWLLSAVAKGLTDRARPAAQRLEKLLDTPASKLDVKGRAEVFRAAIDVQNVGRWPGNPQALHDLGVSLAKDASLSDPALAFELLNAVAPLASREQSPEEATVRFVLLEKMVAADPTNVESASKLANEYATKGELDRAEKILKPLRDRLGEGEGARVLGLCDAQAARLGQAIPLLRAYTKNRLTRLSAADERLQSLYKAGQQRVLNQLKSQTVYDFDFDRYRRSPRNVQEEILFDYVNQKLKGDPEISAAQAAVVSEATVIPVTLELGMVLLQHAQSQGDPGTRKSLLDEAEATFLGVSRMAGDRADLQLSLAQVYYWQGKEAQGHQLFEKVLREKNREPALLLQVAGLLRDLGSQSEARVLAEEGYNHAPIGPIKENCAVIRALLCDDVEERIVWVRRANQNQPAVKAMLSSDLAEQALSRGDEATAIRHLREAVGLYQSMPESVATLNNGSIALMQLATLTADPSAGERAASMIEKAAALDPGNSLTMTNAASSLLEIGLREVIGRTIDLKLLKLNGGVDLLGFLTKDESERQQLAARVRSQPSVNRALSLMDKVMLLAPKNPSSYRAPLRLLGFERDAEQLRAILQRLEGTQLDLVDEINEARESMAGTNDEKKKLAAKAGLARFESILPVARVRGGATFAIAAHYVLMTRMSTAIFGGQVDRDAMVALAEEALAVSPSLGSRWELMETLLFRAADRLAKAEPGFASLRDRFARTLGPVELVHSILTSDGPLKGPTLKDPDVVRAIDLLRENLAASPSFASGPRGWSLLQAKYPDLAASLSRRYFESDSDRIEDQIQGKLRPFDTIQILKEYRIALMQGKAEEASKILLEAKAQGIPIPIEK